MQEFSFGNRLCTLRKKAKLSQTELGNLLHVTNKAVSKWECGNGCPDVSLLAELSAVFGTDVQTLLSGSINKNESEKGNMKKLKFYVCRKCGNIITATSDATVTCCGNILSAEEPRKAEDNEKLKTEDIGGEWYVSSDHPMTKDHYISFAAFLNDSSVMMFRQYPEWGMQFTMPLYRSGRLVWYCTQCGLLYQDIRRK